MCFRVMEVHVGKVPPFQTSNCYQISLKVVHLHRYNRIPGLSANAQILLQNLDKNPSRLKSSCWNA